MNPIFSHLVGVGSWKLHAALWMLPPFFLLFGMGLAILAVGAGPGSRVARALFSAGPAVALLVGLALAVRAIAWVDGWGQGASAWAGGWLDFFGLVPAGHRPVLHPYDTLYGVTLGASLAATLLLPLAAAVDPPSATRPPRLNAPVPGAAVASAALAAAALALPYLFYHGTAPEPGAPFLDFLGLTPVLALALALRLHAHIPVPEAPTARAPVEVWPLARPDLGARWIAAGLATEGLRLPAYAGPAAPSSAGGLWRVAGGVGPPPGGLDRLLQRSGVARAHQLFHVPVDMEIALFTALAVEEVLRRGGRVLMIAPDPSARAEALMRAFATSPTWSPGLVAVGTSALVEAVAGRRLPAVVLTDADDLSEHLLRVAVGEGRPWLLGLRLLLVHRPDAGAPLAVSHTAFTFARWHLATSRWVLPEVVATGPDTPEALHHLMALFPQREGMPCDVALRAPGATRVLLTRAEALAAPEPWVARAASEAAALGLGARLLDLAGRWSGVQLRALPRAGRLEPLDAGSMVELTPAQLALTWASLGNRLPDGPHWSLWNLPETPALHYLLAPRRLESLLRAHTLPIPAPVVGWGNEVLRRTHALAALHEGAPDEAALRRTFGEGVVDGLLARAERPGTWRGRVEGGEMVRSAILRPAGPWEDPYRRTLSDRPVAVLNDRRGEWLDEVDAALAPTRYYTTRVFSVQGQLYVVLQGALDAKRGQLRVHNAPAGVSPTRPLLQVTVSGIRQVDAPITHRENGVVVTVAILAGAVREAVASSWTPGMDRESHFDEVQTSYSTEFLAVVFPEALPSPGLAHLADTLAELLPIFLQIDADDFAIIPAGPRDTLGLGTGLLIVDRHVGSLGLARALHAPLLFALLRAGYELLYSCSCLEGCPRCTAEATLRRKPAKQAAMKLIQPKELSRSRHER